MINLARLRRAPVPPLRGVLAALCMSALAMSALAAPALARGRSRQTAHASLASRMLVHLAVVGGELEWSPVGGVSSYVLRERVDGHRFRRVLAATSAGLTPVRGAMVLYSVRTNVRGSVWGPPVAIVYNRSGRISKIFGGSSGLGESGAGGGAGGSEPGSGGGTSGSGSEPGAGAGGSEPGSGSGLTGSESGSGGSGSGAESGSGGSGSGSGPGTEGGSSGEGGSGSGSGSEGGSGSHGLGGSVEEEVTPKRPAPLKVGLIGFRGWGTVPSETIRKATGVKYTRASPVEEGWGPARELVSEGITPLVLYDPHMAGMPPATVAENLKSYIPIMHELGLTEIELGNEVYYNGSSPAEYALQYRAAHEQLAGSGITLIADAWTDAQKPNGEWSDWEAHGGWCMLFVGALGYVPDAWSLHPYGPMSANHFGSGANRQGWGTVPRMIAYMKEDHIYAPLNITEVGQPTFEGTDGNTAVSEAEQAADVKQYLTQAAEWGLASIYLYEAVDTAEGGYGLYSWPLKAKPSAAVFAETLQQLRFESLAS
jgi:hypothetical protein